MNPDPPPSDRSHENAAFVRSVVEQFQPQLLRYATRLLGDPDRARDAVQDTFVRLLAQPRTAVDGQPPATVAEDLQMTVPAVYTAKSRVLRRLRQVMAELSQ